MTQKFIFNSIQSVVHSFIPVLTAERAGAFVGARARRADLAPRSAPRGAGGLRPRRRCCPRRGAAPCSVERYAVVENSITTVEENSNTLLNPRLAKKGFCRNYLIKNMNSFDEIFAGIFSLERCKGVTFF